MTLDITIIKKAEEMARTPGTLTRFAEARTGKSVFSGACRWDDPRAESWCVIGLIKKATDMCVGRFPRAPLIGIEHTLIAHAHAHAKQLGYPSVSWLNDTGGKKAVRELFTAMKGRAR